MNRHAFYVFDPRRRKGAARYRVPFAWLARVIVTCDRRLDWGRPGKEIQKCA